MNWTPTKDPRIKRRGDFYWARFTKRGQKIEESLGTRSFATAVRMVEEIESCILLGVNWRKERELFETAWPDFLVDKAQGNKTKIAREKTLKEYIGFGERFYLPFFGDYRVTDITDEAWEEFVQKTRETKPDMLFFNARKYLMGFLSWAKRKGKIQEVPELFNPDKRADHEDDDAPGKEYSLDEMREMRDLAPMPFKLCLLMAQYMGMRSSEITQLKKSRVHVNEGIIRLRKVDTKTAQARTVPIHPEVMAYLVDQITHTEGSPFVFPNKVDHLRPMDKTGFKKRWSEVKSEAGIKGRFHDFKHTWITNAIRSGMNVSLVAKIVGTSISVIDKVYLHFSTEDFLEEIRKIKLDKTWTKAVFEEKEKLLSH